jgi:uncharacterized membrane protein YeaQ/YmgE (transglycosylase-associated protein family)
MGLLLWIIFGAIVGWIASLLMRTTGGVLFDIIMGIIGAIVGGLIMSLFGQPGVTGFNLYSVVVSVIGAVVVIYLGRLMRRSP